MRSNIMQNMIARWPRWAGVLLVVVLLGAAGSVVSAIRRPILRAAGWALLSTSASKQPTLFMAVWQRESQFSPILPKPWTASSSAAASPTKTRLHDPFENLGRLASILSSKSEEM
jgi:hypothetical protein